MLLGLLLLLSIRLSFSEPEITGKGDGSRYSCYGKYVFCVDLIRLEEAGKECNFLYFTVHKSAQSFQPTRYSLRKGVFFGIGKGGLGAGSRDVSKIGVAVYLEQQVRDL